MKNFTGTTIALLALFMAGFGAGVVWHNVEVSEKLDRLPLCEGALEDEHTIRLYLNEKLTQCLNKEQM